MQYSGHEYQSLPNYVIPAFNLFSRKKNRPFLACLSCAFGGLFNGEGQLVREGKSKLGKSAIARAYLERLRPVLQHQSRLIVAIIDQQRLRLCSENPGAEAGVRNYGKLLNRTEMITPSQKLIHHFLNPELVSNAPRSLATF